MNAEVLDRLAAQARARYAARRATSRQLATVYAFRRRAPTAPPSAPLAPASACACGSRAFTLNANEARCVACGAPAEAVPGSGPIASTKSYFRLYGTPSREGAATEGRRP